MSVEMEFPEIPNWIPLEKLLPAQCGDFMYMGRAVTNGKKIELYKHIETRSYINIDQEGACYTYTEDGYLPIS